MTSASRPFSRHRLWLLHARARHWHCSAAGVLLVTALAWVSVQALTLGYPGDTGSDRRIPVIAAAPLVIAIVASAGFAGADPDLERSGPTRWPMWRAAYLAGIVVIALAVLPATVTSAPWHYGAAAMARNGLGYLGMAALAAVVLGVAWCWAPPLLYAATVYLAAPSHPTGAAVWWAWPMQPGGWDNSWTCASLLCLAGCGSYIRWGSRPAAAT